MEHGKQDGEDVVDEAEERSPDETPSFRDFLLNGPDLSILDLQRDRSPMRDVDLRD